MPKFVTLTCDGRAVQVRPEAVDALYAERKRTRLALRGGQTLSVDQPVEEVEGLLWPPVKPTHLPSSGV